MSARPIAIVGAFEAVGAVLDDGDLGSMADCAAQRRDVAHLTIEMNRDDRTSPLGHSAADSIRCHCQRVSIDIDKNRLGPQNLDHIRGRDKRHRRHDDLCSGADLESEQCRDRPIRPAVDERGVRDIEIFAELTLYSLRHRPGGQKWSVKNAGNILSVALVQRVSIKGDLANHNMHPVSTREVVIRSSHEKVSIILTMNKTGWMLSSLRRFSLLQ